jgi:NAD(P)-dependent dehydrogenase (short-subunit alcohol dehydrogenase family)
MGQKQSSATNWDGSDMPSQAGKIAIVTGANSGIGYLTARSLAERGAYVILACRSESRGRTAEQEMTAYLTELKQTNKNSAIGSVEFIQVDMSNLASVRAFAKELRRRSGITHVDLLINNAGIVFPSQPLTADGIETQFGVNHLSHFLLTALLMDLLKAAPAARVISVSSVAHREPKSLEFDTLVKGTDRPLERYGKSKLANLLFTYELARHLEAAKISNVISVAVHPGVSDTPQGDRLVESTLPRFLWPLAKWIFKTFVLQPPPMGALPSLYAATAKDVVNGGFYGPNGPGGRRGYPVKEESSPTSHNIDEAAQLWTLSEKLTGEAFAV